MTDPLERTCSHGLYPEEECGICMGARIHVPTRRSIKRLREACIRADMRVVHGLLRPGEIIATTAELRGLMDEIDRLKRGTEQLNRQAVMHADVEANLRGNLETHKATIAELRGDTGPKE